MTTVELPAPAAARARFVDVHYHADPDAYVRRHTAVAAGAHYAELDGWVVLKNHLGSTAAQAWEARQQGLPVSGSVVLNDIAGGLDPRAVLQAVVQHGDDSGLRLIVHLPTVTGRPHRSRLRRDPAHPLLARDGLRPLTVTDEAGTLRPEVRELLHMARDLPIVVSTGHAGGAEVRLLVDEAVRLDVPRLMLNQPASPLTGLTCADLLDLATAEQVYTEQTALTHLLGYQDRDDFDGVLSRVPRVVYSSDLGQTSQMDIAQWRAASRQWFQEAGLTEERVTEITRSAPLRMLRLT
ncbi:DUF6282 family protein [Streptomyces sp. VRA16 Mangrove soil]|uniref:DUF6282 family protein n=1 Tax=Streptomyces sp. VRA16 Mangrove soil TaxID=2817434 RepID=UPI001A9CCE6C|nr:DUF6282 family protein [Streptomyces sp. VRA16 Mangrove soil]MBO1337177.1 hypothetical protein [Streptomyces sp. VRA16 Mangrove soil]